MSRRKFHPELADSEITVRYRPKRFVSFSRHQIVYAKAKSFKVDDHNGDVNPEEPPEHWWVDVNEYRAATDAIKAWPLVLNLRRNKSAALKLHTANRLKISAFAGPVDYYFASHRRLRAGPTRLYLAFNKRVAEEAQTKFPTNVECRTTHSLAYEFARTQYSGEKLSGGLNAIKVAEFLKLAPVSFGEHKNFSARQVGQWVVDTFRAFCQSDSTTPTRQHVRCGRLGQISSPDDIESFTEYLRQQADYMWQHALDPNSSIPLGHDGYLKMWSMSNPKFDKDFIMLDEAQDTNAAVIHALSSQSVKTVDVGDKYQQIYGFRGAFNAMDKIHVDCESALTTSFRFGESIAEVANAIIQRFGDSRKIVGNPSVSSTVNKSPAKTYIYRTNMGVLAGLAHQSTQSRSVYLVGGREDLSALVDDIELMQSAKPAISNADFYGFNNWQDLVSFSKLDEGSSYRTVVQVIDKFGIPQLKQMLKWVSLRPEDSNAILTTAHKSKGMEWDHVEVCEDFATGGRIKNLQSGKYSFGDPLVEEITLLYVALTRARLSLNIPDQILELLNLSKYFRILMPARLGQEVAHENPLGVFNTVQPSPVPVRPVLPHKFTIAQKVSVPAGTSILGSDLTNLSVNTTSPPSDPKLQALIERFKK